MCQPEGPPPENPSSIQLSGGITFIDVHWEAVTLKCPDLLYQVSSNMAVFMIITSSIMIYIYIVNDQVLINGTATESTKKGTDQNRK